MTQAETERARLRVALSEVEAVLDYYDNDQAFAEFTMFQARLFDILSGNPASCVQCGSRQDVTTRQNEDDGVSEPLCGECWYNFDTQAASIYVDQQFAFYERESENNEGD